MSQAHLKDKFHFGRARLFQAEKFTRIKYARRLLTEISNTKLSLNFGKRLSGTCLVRPSSRSSGPKILTHGDAVFRFLGGHRLMLSIRSITTDPSNHCGFRSFSSCSRSEAAGIVDNDTTFEDIVELTSFPSSLLP
jgi:hypothetical protein